MRNYTRLKKRLKQSELKQKQAYAIEVEAKANAEQTRVVAAAIAENGQPAINYEILKRQVDALGNLASGSSTKTVIIPTDVTAAIGSLETLMGQFKAADNGALFGVFLLDISI